MAESDVSRVEAPDAAHAGRYDAFISYARADGAFAIADAEWVFLRDTDDMVAGIERLAEALDTDLQWRDQHTRLAGHVLASRAKTTDVCVVRYTTLGD